MAKNKVLEPRADLDLIVARVLSDATGKTAHVYTYFSYAAGTRSRERHVVCKAEVVRLNGRERKLNASFLVTNLSGQAQRVYEGIYYQCGEVENRIEEPCDAALDRSSCSKLLADQFRVLIVAAPSGHALR